MAQDLGVEDTGLEGTGVKDTLAQDTWLEDTGAIICDPLLRMEGWRIQ